MDKKSFHSKISLSSIAGSPKDEKGKLVLRKHLIYSKKNKNLIFPQKTSLSFQSQFSTNIQNEIDNSAQSHYSYKKNMIFLEKENYKVIEAYNKSTREKKLAKIINKSFLENEENVKYLKREIILHKVLKNSACILKLEDVFETKNHIYLIFEFGKILKGNLKKFGMENSLEHLKAMSLDVLIGLCEISSVKCCLGALNTDMVIRVNNGKKYDFKIFNFENILYYEEYLLSKFGKTMNKLQNEKNNFGFKISNSLREFENEEEKEYHISWLSYLEKADSTIDSRYFGLFLGALYKRHTYTLQNHENFNDDYYSKLIRDEGLEPIDKDFFLGMIQDNSEKVVDVMNLPLHSYFKELLISKDSKYFPKFLKTYEKKEHDFDFDEYERILRGLRLELERERLSTTKGRFKEMKREGKKIRNMNSPSFVRKPRSKGSQVKKTLIESSSFSLKTPRIAYLSKGQSVSSFASQRRKTVKNTLNRKMGSMNDSKTPSKRRLDFKKKEKEEKNFFTKLIGNFSSAFNNMVCCNEREKVEKEDLMMMKKKRREDKGT